MFCTTLFRCGHLLFTWKTHCGLKLHFGQFDRSEICTEVTFTSPEVMWTLIMKLPYIEVKFYPEVKSQTGLSSLRVSCKRALRKMDFSVECFTNDVKQHFTIKRVKIWLFGGLLDTCCQGQVFHVFSCNFLIL